MSTNTGRDRCDLVLTALRRAIRLALCCVVTSWVLGSLVEQVAASTVRFGSPTVLGDRTDRLDARLGDVAINATGAALAAWTSCGAHHRASLPCSRTLVRVAERGRARRWGRAVTLGRSRAGIGPLRVALDAHGDAAVMWMVQNGRAGATVMVATRRPNGRWSRPSPLGRDALEAHLAITGAGRAVVGWATPAGVNVTSGRGRFWSRELRAPAGGRIIGLAMDVHRTGRAVAAWLTDAAVYTPGAQKLGGTLTVSQRSWNGNWTPPQEIAGAVPPPYLGAAPPATDLHASIAGDGYITAVWKKISPGSVSLMTVDYDPARGWSSPGPFRAPTGSVLRMVMNDRREALIGWYSLVPLSALESYTALSTASRTPGGVWSTPTQVSDADPTLRATDAQLAITAAGATFAAWAVPQFTHGPTEPAPPLTKPRVDVAIGDVAHGWGAPIRLTRPGHSGSAVHLAVADGPHAVIGWVDQTARRTSIQVSMSRFVARQRRA